MADIIIREANANDIAFMTTMLLEACSASGVNIEPDALSEHPDTEIYVKGWSPVREGGVIAEYRNGRAVGAAWNRYLPELGHSEGEQFPEITIAVAPEYRRMGIAGKLMNNLYELSARKGICKLSLGVHRNNIPAIQLYEKQGWVREGTFKEYIIMGRIIG